MTYNERVALAKRENAMKLWRTTFVMKQDAYNSVQASIKADTAVEAFYASFQMIDNG